jgi:hypothetical protein
MKKEVKKRPGRPKKTVAKKQAGIKINEQNRKWKVAICGYAPSSRDLAPYDDDSYEIWGVNELYMLNKRIDVLFEMHHYKFLTAKERNPNHLKWLQNAKIPIIMLQHYNDIPTSVPYPLGEIEKKFGTYWTNSISYMIALAVHLNFKQIDIYGIDMATQNQNNGEYSMQRPSVEYFIGVAQGAGIKVVIPPQCDLLKTQFRYGYDQEMITAWNLKMIARKKELAQRKQGYQKAAENQIAAMHQMMGAIDNMNYMGRCHQTPLLDEHEVLK